MTDQAPPPIPYADRAALTGELAAAVDAYEARMGFLPNALRLYMHRPELLQCLIRLNDTAMRDPSSHLDRALKRRIAAFCSALNRSAYCVAHNANTLASDSGGEARAGATRKPTSTPCSTRATSRTTRWRAPASPMPARRRSIRPMCHGNCSNAWPRR